MKFDYKCPYCKSENIEIESNTQVEWGNDFQGILEEDWMCRDCHREFFTRSEVTVKTRELRIYVVCPYCGENDHVTNTEKDYETMDRLYCERCHRYFYIHREEFYQERRK